jgi:hypothetical protein
MVPGVNHFALGFLLHVLGEPVRGWFQMHLEAAPELPAKIVADKGDGHGVVTSGN